MRAELGIAAAWVLALLAVPLGVFGAAGETGLELDGTGPLLEVKHASALDLVEAVSLEAWIKPEQYDRPGVRIIDKSQAGTSSAYLLDTFPGNSLRFGVAAGVTFTREVFATAVDQVVAVRLSANAPGKIAFTAALSSPHRSTVEAAGERTIVLRGRCPEARGIPGAVSFETRLVVRTAGGTVQADGPGGIGHGGGRRLGAPPGGRGLELPQRARCRRRSGRARRCLSACGGGEAVRAHA